MKTNFKKILLVILGISAGLILFFIGKADLVNDAEKIILNINGRDYVLYTARTALEKARGLSGITELKGADGMIFFFSPGSKPTFWNKETHLDLELIWMDGDKIVGRDFLPSEDKEGLITKPAPAGIDKVVELSY
jgi:uncharacterized membrane protein (UPF0127 family)